MKKLGKGFPRRSYAKTCTKCKKEQVVFVRIMLGVKKTINPDRKYWKGDECPSCWRTSKKPIASVLMKPATIPDELGPKKPLFDAKLYNCKRCGEVTFNRYNCPRCLRHLVSGVGEAEFFSRGGLGDSNNV